MAEGAVFGDLFYGACVGPIQGTGPGTKTNKKQETKKYEITDDLIHPASLPCTTLQQIPVTDKRAASIRLITLLLLQQLSSIHD